MVTVRRVRSSEVANREQLVADSPSPRRVVPLLGELGMVSGHRLVLLSIEDWGTWFDLRFARIGSSTDRPLPRRIPPAHAWSVTDEQGGSYTVEDAVGRGDRHLSIGEVRVTPGLPDDATTLRVEVEVLTGVPMLRARVEVPARS